MVKHELRVRSCKSRVTSCELKNQKIQKPELKFKSANWKLLAQSTNSHSRVTSSNQIATPWVQKSLNQSEPSKQPEN